MEKKVIVKRDPTRQITLDVNVTGADLVVSPGTFKISKESYTLGEAFHYTATLNLPNPVNVIFYLMLNKQDGKVQVAADELGPNDLPLNMSNDPTQNYLWQLATLRIPANAASLDGAILTVIQSNVEKKK